MFRKLVSIVTLGGGTVFAIFVIANGTVQEQTDFLADAGVSPPNRDATCLVRFDNAFAADAGLYARVTFPVALKVLPDGGRDVTLPPAQQGAQRVAIDVVNWPGCTLDPTTAPIAALWGTNKPFTKVGVVSPWCRQKTDAGLPCLLLDGGTFGDRNIGPCSERLNPATCQRAAGNTVYLGDSPEDL